MPNENKEYERRSHSHCWNQNGKPACGIPLGKHTQCCLCDLLTPTKTTEEEKIEYLKDLVIRNKAIVDAHAPTKSWEEWVRLLATSNNPRDIELLIAKLKILLSSHIPLEEVMGEIEKSLQEINKKEGKDIDNWSQIGKVVYYYLSSLKQKLEERRTNQK